MKKLIAFFLVIGRFYQQLAIIFLRNGKLQSVIGVSGLSKAGNRENKSEHNKHQR